MIIRPRSLAAVDWFFSYLYRNKKFQNSKTPQSKIYLNDTPSVYSSTTFVGRSMKQIRLFKRNPSVQAFKEIYPSLTPRKGKIPNWVAQTIRLHLRTKKSVSKHYICQPRWRGSVLIITLFLPFLLQLTLKPSCPMKFIAY